ncbi:MAG: hypothetical protein EPN23_09975 [Verrucomicrobia bacterium]|nr:MAG: hypothetical protein EPN23_09975 [Verrucomicrobiota bacterium]
MDPMLSLLISLLSALGGSYGTYYFAIRSKKLEAQLAAKEEKYRKLLIHLQGFVGKTANAESKRMFFTEYYQSWLYSSDEVVLAIKRLIDSIKQASTGQKVKNGMELIGNVVLAMRRDLYGTTRLKNTAFEYTDVIEDAPQK